MRSSPSPLLLASLLALACPAPGGDTTGSGTSAATDTTTGSSGPTSGATTSATSGQTSGPGTSATSEGASSTTTDASTSTTASTATTGDATTAGTSASTGGPTPTQVCVTDADCKLHDDCCTCAGVPVDEQVNLCEQECKQSKCSELGIDAAVCRLGVCTTERLSCDATQVLCDALPPPCPPGTLAETSPACWTGKCVPAEYCDAVPECSLCPEGTLCVTNIAFGPQGWSWCEPIPPDCDGNVTCDCVGDLVCLDEFSACFAKDGDITCECPNC